MQRLGRKPSDIESVSVIEDYLKQNGVKLKKVRKNTPKVRARDAVFDTLAKIDNCNPLQMTRAEAGRVAAVKKQILEVLPEATVEEVVAEIGRRVIRYKQLHRDWQITSTALGSHWSECGGGEKTQSEKHNIYLEPATDWRTVFCYLFGIDREVAQEKLWPDLSPDYRMAILKEMAKKSA